MSGGKCAGGLICLSILLSGVALAEAPDSEINPVTGAVESVMQSWGLMNWNVMHATDSGADPPIVVFLENAPSDGLRPRIAIRADGYSGVVWWIDGAVDEVFFSERTAGGGWSGESRISEAGQDSRSPEIISHGNDFWMSYEVHSVGSVEITLAAIREGAEPFPPSSVASTESTTTLDVRVHSESSYLWTSWIDSETEVGWAEYDAASETWSLPGYESYAADDVPSARARIQGEVTGG